MPNSKKSKSKSKLWDSSIKIRTTVILIPVIAFLSAEISFLLIRIGFEGLWFNELVLPFWTPKPLIIALIWTLVYSLAMAAIMMVFSQAPKNKADRDSMILIFIGFLLNVLLNILWSFVFFYKKELWGSMLEATFLAISSFLLLILVYPRNRWAALILLPYILWMSYIAFLSGIVAWINA